MTELSPSDHSITLNFWARPFFRFPIGISTPSAAIAWRATFLILSGWLTVLSPLYSVHQGLMLNEVSGREVRPAGAACLVHGATILL